MSKFVNRIFNKKTKTLDDIHFVSSSSAKAANGKNSTLPRSKTTHLNVANGRSPSPSPITSPNRNFANKKGHKPLFDSSVRLSSTKNGSVIRTPPDGPSPIGACLSPVEIPVEEALRLIAEDPPHVARSTPKGMPIDTSRWKEEHDMKHCIYDRAVYERMIDNSLKTCEQVQHNLDTYIEVVRQTSSRGVTPVKPVLESSAKLNHKA